MRIKDGVRLLRPKQWVKGLLVFAALLFGKAYANPAADLAAVTAFFAMALISSAVYVSNDLLDVSRDRNHPIKQNRPLASGTVGVPAALGLLVVCLLGGLVLAARLGPSSLGVILAYLGLQVAYNLWFKRQPVADVFCLSLGFVLRAALGAAAINVAISGWLLFCTGALALMLGFGKRRHEFIFQGDQRETSREALGGYNRVTIDALLVTAAGTAAMSYGIYSIESPTAKQYPALIFTSLFVFYGIYRYLYLLLAKNEGGEPESLLLRDRHMVFTVLLFVASALLALSGYRVPFVE